MQRIRLPMRLCPSMDMHKAVLLSDLNARVSARFLLKAAILRGFPIMLLHCLSY